MGVNILGTISDEGHRVYIQQVCEEEQYYRELLSPIFQQMVVQWKLYLGDRDDPRLPHEKDWRANVHVPWPYSSTETQVATVADMLFSQGSLIEPEAVGTEDEEYQTKIGRLLDHFMRRMRFRSKFDVAARESTIQGTSIRKATWREVKVPFMHMPTSEEKTSFDKAVFEAAQRGAGEPPQDADELMIWIDMVNEAGNFGEIPEPPIPGPRDFVKYRGASWDEVPIFDMRFDPHIMEYQQQPVMIQHIVKPLSWVMKRTGPTEDFPFDPENVAAAMSEDGGEGGGESGRFSLWEEQIASMMGIKRSSITEPRFRKFAHLWEVWRVGDKLPYTMVMNRKAVINKHPDEMPYWHQEHPFHPLRNVLLPGKAFGLAEMTQLVPLFVEMDTLRNLRIDSVTMSILPILLRLKDMGLPEQLRRLVPGMIMDVTRLDGVKSLSDNIRVPPEAFRELQELKIEVDETQGTQDIVRGSSAPFSRTTATEITNRMNRALGRQKQRVIRIEDELSSAVPQWLMLAYQFAPAEWRVKVGGRDPSRDAFQRYSRADFWEGLHQDFRFRGATNSINRELEGQQLQEFFARILSSPQPILSPGESRNLARRIFMTMGQRGMQQIFTPEGEQFVALQTQLTQAAMLQQLNPEGATAEGEPPPQ